MLVVVVVVVVGLRVVYEGGEKVAVAVLVMDVLVTMEGVDLGAMKDGGEDNMGGIIAMFVLMWGGEFGG
jgi:hypothetical protein